MSYFGAAPKGILGFGSLASRSRGFDLQRFQSLWDWAVANCLSLS